MYFDSHTHLNDRRLFSIINAVIKRAQQVEVTTFMVPSYDYPSIQRALELTKIYPMIYVSAGIHPSDSIKYDLSILAQMENLIKVNPKVRAIGEIGLDYHWAKNEAEKAHQRLFFISQIELANRLQLPVVIHMRDADHDTMQIIQEHRPHHGFLMHCFSGSRETMDEVIKLGGYIALGGPVTFSNAVTPKEIARAVPLDRLLIETDAPYLSPHPHRGEMNEPSYLPLIAQTIAQLRGIELTDLAAATAENAKRFFHVE